MIKLKEIIKVSNLSSNNLKSGKNIETLPDLQLFYHTNENYKSPLNLQELYEVISKKTYKKIYGLLNELFL